MHKYWKQIAAGSLAVMLATPVPIQAAIKKSIYVGDVVSITAADLQDNKIPLQQMRKNLLILECM